MLQTMMVESPKLTIFPSSSQDVIETARQIRICEEEMFREMLQKRQIEIDLLHEELYRVKEELATLKSRFWR